MTVSAFVGCASNRQAARQSESAATVAIPRQVESDPEKQKPDVAPAAANPVEPVLHSRTNDDEPESFVDLLIYSDVDELNQTAGASDPVSESQQPITQQSISSLVSEIEPAHPQPLRLEGEAGLAISESDMQINLPTALSMVAGDHPAVGLASWRVQEAYAELDRAKVLWLPSIRAGFHFHRHDGNYQASDASIIDVNRNSFLYGLGVGATGAGTTQRPGLIAEFHLADAIFQPKIARKDAWARGHAVTATVNDQLHDVAAAYAQLLAAYQDQHILIDSRDRIAGLSKITTDFAETGRGLDADADRLRTEVSLVESRVLETRQSIAQASAVLAEAVSAQVNESFVPLDFAVVPIEMVNGPLDRHSLIALGLANRPELKESQALIAAACEAYRREKYSPLVPNVSLGFSTGGFGGGLGSDIDNVASRYDFDAMVSWEVRNLGLGEKAARRQTSARVQQARFEKLRIIDSVAREISESCAQIQFRSDQIEITRQAIDFAKDSYDRNLNRIKDGQGLPIEVLQSVVALEAAQRAYLQAVTEHNLAQYRLQRSLGWPISEVPSP